MERGSGKDASLSCFSGWSAASVDPSASRVSDMEEPIEDAADVEPLARPGKDSGSFEDPRLLFLGRPLDSFLGARVASEPLCSPSPHVLQRLSTDASSSLASSTCRRFFGLTLRDLDDALKMLARPGICLPCSSSLVMRPVEGSNRSTAYFCSSRKNGMYSSVKTAQANRAKRNCAETPVIGLGSRLW